MPDRTRFIGLDVHAKTIAIAVAEEGRDEPQFLEQIPNDTARLLKELDRLGERSSLHCAYEAGPTGYGLQRALAAAGVICEVIAPWHSASDGSLHRVRARRSPPIQVTEEADELPRADAERRLERRSSQARRHHEGRERSAPAAPRRSCLGVSPHAI